MGKKSEQDRSHAGVFTYPEDHPFSAPELSSCPANHSPLTPLTFLRRSAHTHPASPSVVHGKRRFTWKETLERCTALASGLRRRGIKPGDVVSAMMTNIPEMYEAHFGVPMAGAILNALNFRLDDKVLGYILAHAETKVLLCEDTFLPVMKSAVEISGRAVDIIVVPARGENANDDGFASYEALLQSGDAHETFPEPADEAMPISLNYTSGTTGQPKGVVYSYRGAYLIAMCNVICWNMPGHSRYLWTLPMFHCNGWCFPWVMASVSGVSVCLPNVNPAAIGETLRGEQVEWLCGAPVVLNMLIENLTANPLEEGRRVKFMVAAAPPPAATLQRAEEVGIDVLHVYGLTETYGPSVVCEWKPEWNSLGDEEKVTMRSRQGVPYHALEGLMVADSETNTPKPGDGETIGEVMARGNAVMLGYLKEPEGTAKAFAGGWFHTGDLGVMELDGYVRLKDRAKDIIISGGENISSIEIENILYRHPAVATVAVVAKSDPKWGETPCAVVELKEGQSVTEQDLIDYCRENMASFKCPRYIVFDDIPKTSTGKVQKYVLRKRIAEI